MKGRALGTVQQQPTALLSAITLANTSGQEFALKSLIEMLLCWKERIQEHDAGVLQFGVSVGADVRGQHLFHRCLTSPRPSRALGHHKIILRHQLAWLPLQ